nr:GLPGLI family protein [uncultured Flavobacterium sp.]
MKFYPFILFLFSLNVFCQTRNIMVEYEVISSIKNNEILIANNKKALYIKPDYASSSKSENIVKTESNNDMEETTISQLAPLIYGATYYKTLKKDLYYYLNDNKNEIIKDELPDFNWNVTYTETKMIGNFLCKKATTIFRGTNIEAWYTEEINIPFGPWKFKGLPGLILEVYNVNDFLKFHWIAKKVVFPYKEYVDFEFDTKARIIPLKKIFEDQEIARNEENKKMMSLMPQGGSIRIGKSKRLDIEKIYEWED